MNSIRRALTAERKRLFKLSPISIIQEQHASSSSSTRSLLRTLKSSQTRAPEVRSQVEQAPAPAPSTTSSSSNDAVLKELVTWPKPSEIPWQAKVVNSVNLIGRVKIPVQFEASPDGKYWAGTIISQDDGDESSSSLTSFWIPVIFEGDLAYIAMCHLKEKDCVHVAGHLSVDIPPFKLSEVQANVQVMVHSLNFVQDRQSKKTSKSDELHRWIIKNTVHDSEETGRLHSDHKVDKRSIHALWRDLLTNSKEWLDNRENKCNGLVKVNYPDFKRKDTGVGLWLDSAPAEILQGLGQLEFYVAPSKAEKGTEKGGEYLGKGEKGGGYFNKAEKGGEYIGKGEKGGGYFNKAENGGGSFTKGEKDGDSWKDLVENPNKWWDNRLNKVKANYPDFKHKDTGVGLWLDRAPAEILQRLGQLEFYVAPSKAKKGYFNKAEKGGEYLGKGERGGGYFNKPENGGGSFTKGEKDGDYWKDLVENPNKWWDNRLDKRNKKAPDFKNKDSGKGLWLGDAPAWSLTCLPPVKARCIY